MSTKFFTNTESNTLLQKFEGIFQNMTNLYAFKAVVGYFRSSGYFAIQPYLNRLDEVKILVGINVDQMFAEAQKKGMMYFGDEDQTKEEFLKWFQQDLCEAKYSKEVEEGIQQFVEDLLDGKIEVRAHNSKTLHAKFYLFLPEQHSEHSDGWVIMGSSNLSASGLGIQASPTYELNVSLKDYDDVNFAHKEFNELWKQSTPILPVDIQKFKEKTYLGQTFTPFEIYLKLLIEYFGDNIDYDPDTVGDLPSSFKKLSYQIDAVNQGFRMLTEHNGFFLADVVGLGKTVVATMIAKRFLIANGTLKTKILVVYPPALEKNWKSTFRMFGIDRHTKFITNGRLEKILDESDVNYWKKEEYDLILVDEAHKYRNHTSKSFKNLQRICKAPRSGDGLVKGNRKKIVLISATPLNNRPQDLYYQLQLFQDSRKSTLPISNLQAFFGPIIRQYREIIQSDNPDIGAIQDMYHLIREKIIEQITVRRTRKDLENYPNYMQDLHEQGIRFPTPQPLQEVRYDLGKDLTKLFYHTSFYLVDPDKIKYYRYQAIRYLKPEFREQYYEQAILVSESLAGIMKTLMVKRLESSFVAFKTTLNNLLVSTGRMIEMFENDKVLIAPDLNINELIEKGYSMEEIENLIENYSLENPRNNIFKAEDFEPELLEGLKKDYELLTELKTKWGKVNEDPKLERLFLAMDTQMLNKETNPSQQLVIFTESNDTADYLESALKKNGRKGILKISSKNRNKVFETIQANFDANYLGERKNDYKILITTDVLAEGVNLHRANVLVNYDTPWNATRLMQRLGRINRIGSESENIYSYNFYPSAEGDDLIKLYEKSLVKLQGFHTAFGEDSKIFTHEELVEQFELFQEGMTDDEDKRLLYLRFIREYKDQNPKEFKRIQNFPLKARTGRRFNKVIKGKEESTLVFLKSTYKTDFFEVSGKQVKPLTFIEAAERFEAKPTEKGIAIPDIHFEHVQRSIREFERDYLGSTTETVTTTDRADAISRQANKFLRDTRGITTNEQTKKACTALEELIDKGTYTPLPNEIRKMKRQLDKRQITYGQVDNLLIGLAKSYDAFEEEEAERIEHEGNITPEIVITETFSA